MTEKKSLKDGDAIVVYCTKYALTIGIVRVHGKVVWGRADLPYVSVKGNGFDWFLGSRDWHVMRADADQRVAEMLQDAKKSLEKKRATLDRLSASLASGTFKLVDHVEPEAASRSVS